MNGAGGEVKNTVVCVTGASGYIASWLVKLLLQRGYTVKATVRNLKDPKRTEHITSLEGAKERLHLFEADLLEEGSFDSIIHGCHGVFHTASPCFFECTEPQTQLIEPAVKGTLNVLTSCSKSLHSVKRVILTSSIAAMLLTGTPLTPQTLVDETWFSNPQICKDIEFWYVLSKTLAEEAAWKFVKEKGIDMVAINPAMVLGPLLQPTLNFSCSEIWKVVNNDLGTYPNYSYGWVHVYDVADAHIRALEIPSANGRYCLTESVVHNSDMFNLLLKLYPNLKLSNKCEDGPVMPTFLVSKERAKSLGIKCIPFEMGLKETIESLKEKKFVTLHYHDF